MKIVVLDGYTLNPGDLSWKGIQQLGDCVIYDRTPADEVVSRCEGANIVLTNKVKFDATVIAQLPELRYIGVTATGYNVVDTIEARHRGIVVTNIPAYSTQSVAQMTFSHILHFAQNISVHAASVQRGEWVSSKDFCYWKTPQTELAGKTMGIVGYGKIGQAVAKLALAFGLSVVYQNRSIKSVPDIEARQVSLDELLAQSDYVSINCPLTDDNEGFVNKQFIEKMRPTAILINTGRGPLIHEQDLADALNASAIAGAGIDVLSTEPPAPNNPLLRAKNCNITPHIAWATLESRSRLLGIIIENIQKFQEGNPVNVVN